MWSLSRQQMRKHSLFSRSLRPKICVLAFLFVSSLIVAEERELPVLHVYTEVRDGSQVLNTRERTVWVDNDMSRLLEAVLEESGLNYQVAVVPWSRMMNNVANEANSLVYPIIRLPERENNFHWIGEIRPIDAYLFGLRSRLDTIPHTLEAARELRIGTMRGDAFHDFFLANDFGNIVILGNNTSWVSMLERDRIDLMPLTLSGIETLLALANRPADTLVPAVRLDALSHPLYFVMNLNSDPELVETVIQAYRRVVQNGTFERVMGLRHPGF